jgi:hypothetical protein
VSARRAFAAIVLGALLVTGLSAPAAGHHGHQNSLWAARVATAKFHSIARAEAAGYGEFRDAAGIACIDDPAGGMGVHYVNGDLVTDPRERATAPEALVYEPTRHGLRLVAVEYIVFKKNWDATHSDPPTLFDQEFEEKLGADRYGIPEFYELHVWLWRHNPSGLFEDWNPGVVCP